MKRILSHFKNAIVLLIRKWKRRRNRIKRFLSLVCGGGKHIFMPETDYFRLLKVLKENKKEGKVKWNVLANVELLLNKAYSLALRRVPHDLVTMNSKFVVLTLKGIPRELCLVYPGEEDKGSGKISILSWLGIALIGKKEGDWIRRKLYIMKIIYQPEAHDDFHL